MKIAVIGGGAAGLMAAATIYENHPTAEIFIIEKNPVLGKKVMLSGGGRCNVTTGIQDIKIVLTKYPRGGKFLSSAMHKFSPQIVAAWFESHGVPLKTEKDFRVFPCSNKGEDVVRVFEKLFHSPRIHVMLNTCVTKIKKHTAGFEIILKEQKAPLITDALVLTTGGQAYRHTGSTGDGYTFAQELGHTITPLAPSLSGMITRESWPARISGLSFPHARLNAQGKNTLTFTGSFLFTHKGISGPAVFALSSLVAFKPCSQKQPINIEINLFPDHTAETLYDSIKKIIAENPKKSFANVLATLVPKSLAEIVCEQLTLSHETRAAEMGKKAILRALHWLQHIPLHIIARGIGDEFVTAGGVALKEVNPSTMESKLCPKLYFAGEILDIDGFTGGFNLQASWATGHCAGASITKK